MQSRCATFPTLALIVALVACGGGSTQRTDAGVPVDTDVIDAAIPDASALLDLPEDPSAADPGPADGAPGPDADAADAVSEPGGEDAPEADPREAGTDLVCGTCLDGVCQPECGETAVTCPGDCVQCKNGKCEPGEGPLSCPEDCCGGGCGDGVCMGFSCGESPANCPGDCGTACGNQVCDKGESPQSCPMDCAWQVCGNGICEASDNGSAGCPSDCRDTCGNCECEGTEDWLSCAIDCGYCGDGICSPCLALGDEEKNCEPDCGPDTEVCNGYDDDGDGATDEQDATGCVKFYRDMDGDGFGVWTDALCLCAPASSWSAFSGADCDDGNALRHPGAVETCDGFDNDCNAIADDAGAEGCEPWYRDVDLDGYGSDLVAPRCLCGPDPASAFSTREAGDCLDTAPEVHPGAVEACDGLDNDCNGVADEGEGAPGCVKHYLDGDGDGDGYGVAGDFRCLCGPDGAYATSKTGDCDDADVQVNPGRDEDCGTPADDDCSGSANDLDATGCTDFHMDQDGDGWGLAESECRCEAKGLFRATQSTDCDDMLFGVNPAASEDCLTATDDDCNGTTDATDALHCVPFYEDVDGDGAGAGASECRCAPAGQFVTSKGGDCAPDDPAVFPGAGEDCATPGDDDCDGLADALRAKGCKNWYADSDGDGYGSPFGGECWWAAHPPRVTATGGDCNDTDPVVYPAPHAVCGKDADCDGVRTDPGEACDPVTPVSWGGCLDCQATEFLAVMPSAGSDWGPAVAAAADGGFVLAWTHIVDILKDGVPRAQRFDASGAALGTPLDLDSLSYKTIRARVAVLTDDRYVVGWTRVLTDQNDGYAQILAADGTVVVERFQVHPSSSAACHLWELVALPKGRFAAVWSESKTASGSVYLPLFSGVGNQIESGPIAVNTTQMKVVSEISAAATPDGGVVVVWAGAADSAKAYSSVVRGQRFGPTGAKVGSEFVIEKCTDATTVAVWEPDVSAAADGTFTVAWASRCSGSSFALRVRRYSSAGSATGDPVTLASSSSARPFSPQATTGPDGRFGAMWTPAPQDGSPNPNLLRTDRSWSAPSTGTIRTVNVLGSSSMTVNRPNSACAGDGTSIAVWGVFGTADLVQGIAVLRFDADGNARYR